MRKIFSTSCLAVLALCALSLAGLPAYGQVKAHTQLKKPALVRQGMVQDWSHRHVVYPRGGSLRTLMILQHDPRAMQSWQAASRANWHRPFGGRNFKKGGFHRDWSISLGTGGTAPAMYPAKYSFDVNATPSCTNDFIVYPVNTTGSASQPNIVGFNNLYSGTAGSTGICNRPTTANDDGVSATTMWSYNINGGTVATSPTLSLDGTRVAFVENVLGVAHFNVLAWKSGDGVATNLQNVLVPKSLSAFSSTAPVAGSGTVTDLTLGSAADTLSSPFVDYYNDLAYIGNDTGTLYRIKNVFCFTVACSGGGTPAPSLDTTWGSSGALATGCTGKLSGPVLDGVTGNIFVGCSDGTLYGFTSAGVALAHSPLTVGNGGATGGIVDPPMLDVTSGFVYVVAGNSAGGTAVLVQAKTLDLSSPLVATLGTGGVFNLHAPAFNDAYFSSVTYTDWLLYALGYNSGSTQVTLYGVTFDGSRNLITGPPVHADNFGFGSDEMSPITEFMSGGQDRMFECALGNFGGNLAAWNIPPFPTGPPPFGSYATVGATGTSGIVVDNAADTVLYPQAASIYFTDLSNHTAVKLTQTGLQ